jgi:L-asparaginase
MIGRSRIAVIFTGGTIAMTVEPGGSAASPALTGADLLSAVPELDRHADVVAVDLGSTPASHFSFSDVLRIEGLIRDALGDPRLAGVVVVQGTDTLEETAFAWDLCHADERPVVVTGAMRNASEADWDGPANLRGAVRVAASPAARGAGVLVEVGGRVHAADRVAKRHATALDAIATRDGSPLGSVGLAGCRLRRRGPRRRLPVVPEAAALPVPILVAALDTDGTAIDAAVDSGARGIVVAATGAGNTHPDVLRAAVAARAAGVPVALTSRTGAGAVGPHYRFPGGGATWAAAGIALAGGLTPVQARVALALGIGAGLSGPALAELLAGPDG